MGRKAKKEPVWNDCAYASIEVIRDCANGKFRSLVWRDEGIFLSTGSFQFNDHHRGMFEPLLMDKVTADMFLAAHDALDDERRAKFVDWVAKDRGHFGAVFEMVQQAVSIVGFSSRSY